MVDLRASRRDPSVGTAAVVLFTVVVIWALFGVAVAESKTVRADLPECISVLESAVLLFAGTLRIWTARLSEDTCGRRAAVAFLIMGLAVPLTTVLSPVLSSGTAAKVEAPEARLFDLVPLLVAVFTLAGRNRRTLRLIVLTIAVTTAAVISVLAVTSAGIPLGEQHARLWISLEAVSSGAWLAFAVLALTHRTSGAARSAHTWGFLGMMLMATSEALRAWSLSDGRAPHGVAAGVQLSGAVLIAVGIRRIAVVRLAERVSDDELGRMLLLRHDQVAELERTQRERLHDARSVILGVRGASYLLSEKQTHGSADRQSLRQMLDSELDRLHELLDTERIVPCAPFDIRDALLPVIVTHRLAGAQIDDALESVICVGRAMATATVLDNLLRNAAQHAASARIKVHVRQAGQTVEIVVEDDGPGIPTDQRQMVLLPGVRGRDACGSGSGLGLYNSMRAMAEQNGALSITGGRHGGTRVVLSLPACSFEGLDTALAG